MVEKDESEYTGFLQKQFNQICNESNDYTPLKPQYEDMINRQEILFMQFQIEKKGKNFGITESRLLKINNHQLFQIDKYLQEKPIPFPDNVQFIKKGDNDPQWNIKYDQYHGKILLTFTQRTEISIYLRSAIQFNEIGMFLLANIRKRQGKTFSNSVDAYKSQLISNIVQKIHYARTKSVNFRDLKRKIQTSESIRSHFSDKVYVKGLMRLWKYKSLFSNRKVNLEISILELQTRITNVKGALKLWTETTLAKRIMITEQNMKSTIKKGFRRIVFNEDFRVQLKDINYLSQISIQIEDLDNVSKTQTFVVADLKKASLRTQTIILNLYFKGQISYLKIKVNFRSIKEATPQKMNKITPRHYRIIKELYCRDDQSCQAERIHHHFQSLYNKICSNRPLYVTFNKLKILVEYLKIEDLINKFLTVEPFKDYINVTSHKGTFIYRYFLRDYQKQLFYDVERLMWKFKDNQYKPILTALKIFDQNPKFNFTDPFFHLVKRINEMAQRQTLNKWKQQLFSKDSEGIQSIAFFITMGVIKLFPSIFIHQQFINKKALPFNSLLFKYTIEKELSEMMLKVNRIQLNIEAYFGINFVNLLSNLLEGQCFTRILLMIIEQKRQNMESNYLVALVSAFLSLMELVDSFSCSYVSAEHYILTFQETAQNITDHIHFFQSIQKWKNIVKKHLKSSQFQVLADEMIEFYLNNAYSGDLGQISRQIYKQFSCYHYKNENQLRKIIFFFDKIDIGAQESSILTLTIFQSAVKLYEHEFKGINLGQLDHLIEIKLMKLQELNIICNTQKNSYSCRIDPKEVPSNLYFHFVKPLILTYHLSPESNRHIFFQAYIKDSCQIDNLENPIPNKYKEIILEKSINKEDITFCKKFNKTFRMRQNNFNLLYSKLGWFGNHYLIPDERFISMQILGQNRAGEDQLYARTIALNKYTRTVFGKAFSPFPIKESRCITVQIIKENIHTTYQPTNLALLKSSQINELNIYNSASRLLCYELDNFYISSSMNYAEFYYSMMEKLPLIRYLSYQPKEFYLLPSFSMQISSHSSVCTILVSAVNGRPFLTTFTAQEIQLIEQSSSFINKLPEEIELSYAPSNLLFDQYLYYLRLNILQILTLNGSNKKQNKGKKWPNTLVCLSSSVPNYEVYHFYQLMNETKQIIQLQLKESKKKGLSQRCLFDDFGWIEGRWINVYCITKFKASQAIFYYVMAEITRRKYILNEKDLIQTQQKEKPLLILNDDVSNSMEIITYQLAQMFQL